MEIYQFQIIVSAQQVTCTCLNVKSTCNVQIDYSGTCGERTNTCRYVDTGEQDVKC